MSQASSSFGAEISSERRLSDAARERVLMALAEQRSRAVDAFWTELAVYHGPFVMANERAIAALLQRVQARDNCAGARSAARCCICS